LSEAELAKRLAACCDEGLISAGLEKDGEKVPVKLTVSMINTAEGGLMLCFWMHRNKAF
jgi:hypothetical protein